LIIAKWQKSFTDLANYHLLGNNIQCAYRLFSSLHKGIKQFYDNTELR
jgi:hypothetical protein